MQLTKFRTGTDTIRSAGSCQNLLIRSASTAHHAMSKCLSVHQVIFDAFGAHRLCVVPHKYKSIVMRLLRVPVLASPLVT